MLCSDKADLHLFSKTMIDFGDEYKPFRGAWMVEVTIRPFISDNPVIRLPNMAWSFVDGFDLVLSPPLTNEQQEGLAAIIRASPSDKIMMSHSETAIFVKPSVPYNTLKTFIDNCNGRT